MKMLKGLTANKNCNYTSIAKQQWHFWTKMIPRGENKVLLSSVRLKISRSCSNAFYKTVKQAAKQTTY
jgi:hypothetical protein